MQENPLTVLVVDDELPLREELRFFPWSSFNAELVGEAENGEEALELCRKLIPDVVITDITMPVMDGMELFRSVKKEYPLTQVILLTCHSDFEYARDALRLGALEYLTKVSLHDSDLEQALDKARLSIQREQNHRHSELDKQRWQLSKQFSRIGDQAALNEPSQKDLLKSIEETLELWKITFPLSMIRLHVQAKAEDELYVHHELQILLSLKELQSKIPLRWVLLDKSDYLIVYKWNIEDEQQLLEQTIKSIGSLQESLEQRLPFLSESVRIHAALNSEITDGSDFMTAINKSQIHEASTFYDNSGTVYGVYLQNQAAPGVMDEASRQRHAEWIRKATAESLDALVRYIRESFTAWAYSTRPAPHQLKLWLLTMRAELLKDSIHSDDEKTVNKFKSSRTLTELTAAFIHEVENTAGIKNKCRKEIQLAKQLIAERLAEPLTLTQTAEWVGLSSYYLSRLFREEVGESFNEYVTRLRMDKAIHLLQTTTLKVYEIAEQVGIPSYRYFSVLFRSRTGVAPTDFKKG